MLATLVGLSMLLAVVGGTATLVGCLLGRRLRAWQARRHPQQAATRERTRQARRLAAEWPLLAQTLRLGYTDHWTRQHRFPVAEFVADDQGLTATVAAIAGASLTDYQRAANYLADTWGCVSVRAEQQGPGRIRLRGLHRDPLLAPAQVDLSGTAPASLTSWWLGWAEDSSPVFIRSAEVSGMVIGGLAGFGKTMLVAHFLGQLVPSPAVQFVLVDGKGGPDYDQLFPRAWLHSKDDLTDVRDALRRVHRLMVDRQGAIAQVLGVTDAWHLGPSPSWPLVVVVIDEAHTFFHERKGTSPEVKAHNALVAELSRLVEELVRKGRNVAIQVMLLTQRATGDAIPTRIRDNCQVAISFATRTLDGAVAALGRRYASTPTPPRSCSTTPPTSVSRSRACPAGRGSTGCGPRRWITTRSRPSSAPPLGYAPTRPHYWAARHPACGSCRRQETWRDRANPGWRCAAGGAGRGRGPGRSRLPAVGGAGRPGWLLPPPHPPRRKSRAGRPPNRGEVRTVYDSQREPDRVLLKACGTRRESRCPSCAAVYRADAYQLLAAGLKGGKGVPDSISEHPRLFVTFTAPSFGRVHTRKVQGRLVLPCHPYRQGARCPHGQRAGCWHRHDEDDPRLGEPLCPGCYDSQAQVLWNALAPELWRRTTITVQRALARLVGLQEAGLRRLVRISYAKVAEFQRRGAIHFHAVLRLDAATDCRCPDCLAPPPEPFTAALLEDALRQAVPAIRVPCPPLDEGPGRYARWGEQLDVHNITVGEDQAGELSAEQVAGYIAKYATKATESFGSGLDRRLIADDNLDRLTDLPAHVAELVRAAWELGGRPGLEGLRLRAWAHMLGFRGHWSTKSRRYSTTFSVLRRARVAFAKRRRARDGVPLDAWGRPEDDQAVIVVASWVYVGAGYETEGERWLALSAAARAREQRRIAREELTTTSASAAA